MSNDLKLEDLLELSRVYAPEYNMPELHDRVLVLNIMKDGWEARDIIDKSRQVCEADPTKTALKSDQLEESTVKNDKTNNDDIVASNKLTRGEDVTAQTSTIEADSTSAIEKKNTSVTSDNLDVSVTKDPQQEFNPDSLARNLENSGRVVLRQHKIFVHSSWLAVQSKYFRSLFFSGMKESSCKEVHMNVSKSEESPHLMLLEAMYKADILNNATVDELLAVLELADRFDVRFVFKKCKYVLQTRANTVDICKQIMYVIKEKHNLGDVEDLITTLQFTMGQLFSPLENFWQKENFISQSEPFVQYLLSSNQLSTQCENTVFHALMHWMEVNNIDPLTLSSKSDLLKSVRFENLTIDYLYNVVRVHPLASKMPGFQDLMMQGMTYHALSDELKLRSPEVAPAERHRYGSHIVQYCWTIEKNKLLTYDTKSNLSSDDFWFCGYQAKFTVNFSPGTRSSSTYSIVFTSHLLNLTAKNFGSVSWRLQSNCIVYGCVTFVHQFSLSRLCESYSARLDISKMATKFDIHVIADLVQ